VMHDTATGNERRFSKKSFGIWSGKAERNRRLQSDQKIGDVAAFKENVCLLEVAEVTVSTLGTFWGEHIGLRHRPHHFSDKSVGLIEGPRAYSPPSLPYIGLRAQSHRNSCYEPIKSRLYGMLCIASRTTQ
jgi:hypothetical protein